MEGPFNFPSPTERQGSSLCTASYSDWNVGGQLTTTTRTLNNPRYGDLPDALVTLNANYQLPAYSQAVWNATQRSRFGKSFQVYLFNAGGASITISAGDNWSVANFMLTAGTGCLLLVIDNGISATGVPMSPSSASGGFNTSTVGPITATNPVALGGTLVLTNTALDSIATNNWKAGSLSSIGGQNSVAVGHLANVVANDCVAIGYQASAWTRSIAIGLGTVAINDSVSIGDNAISSNNYTVLIGGSTSASAESAIAIGYQANTVHTNSIVIGKLASATGAMVLGGIAIGESSATNGGIAIGRTTTCLADGVSIGRAAVNNGSNSVAIGDAANVVGDSVAVGEGSGTAATGGTALGWGAQTSGQRATAIGYGSSNTTNDTCFIGRNPTTYPTNDYVTQTAGYYKSSQQRVGVYSFLYNTALVTPLTAIIQGWTVSYEPVSFTYYTAPSRFLFLEANSTYLVVFQMNALQPGTNITTIASYQVQLNYYNSVSATWTNIYEVDFIRPDVSGSSYFTNLSYITRIVRTSANPNDEINFEVEVFARPGNPSLDFKGQLQIMRIT